MVISDALALNYSFLSLSFLHHPGSLKSSSRRRPVSVDYELNSNSWENDIDDPSDSFTVGGAMGGGVLKETTNRSSHYSNRNSHPLTEREMEQGLQSLEGQKGKETVVLYMYMMYIFR